MVTEAMDDDKGKGSLYYYAPVFHSPVRESRLHTLTGKSDLSRNGPIARRPGTAAGQTIQLS